MTNRRLLLLLGGLITAFVILPVVGLPHQGIDLLSAAGYYYAQPTATPTTAPSGGGGGGGGGAASTAPSTTLSFGSTPSQIAAALTGNAPASLTATVNAAAGGVVIAGNVGIVVPPIPGVTGNVTVTVTATPPSLAAINAGGPAQFSPNGTILDITITDSSGNHITVFPAPLTVVTKPNAADLTMAGGNLSNLTLAYAIDANSPAGENPNGYPPNTLVIVPSNVITIDPVTGTITANLNFLGSIIGVVTNPIGYVQTLNPNAQEYSSFDPNTSQSFSNQPQFKYLQVTEPQIGDRLLVLDPDTGNYAYVNASDIGPSGPPPGKSSSAVVRGLVNLGS